MIAVKFEEKEKIGLQYALATLPARPPPPPVKKRPMTRPPNLLPMTPPPMPLQKSLPMMAPMQKNK